VQGTAIMILRPPQPSAIKSRAATSVAVSGTHVPTIATVAAPAPFAALRGLENRALPRTADVVIVGAGPTGLALACVLAAKRVSFVLVERLAEGANTSRAAVVHARTLEVLEELEVSERLRAEGHVVPRFTLRGRDRVLATIQFDGLPTRYPHTLMIPQNVTEAILLARLRELGSAAYRPCSVEDVRQDAEGVSVTVASDGHPG